ncbi:MAG: hypothetical protein QN716_01655 [Nitrososphaeraceae archaeon]|nr:hypothetical protein [Nitrososphaeraceae archaeon]
MFFIPAETEVILKPYTTEQCPVVPFEAEQATHVGERWVVMDTRVIRHNNVDYKVLRLRTRFPSEYPGMEWFEPAVQIAFVPSPY